MKKVLLIVALCFSIGATAAAQTVKKDVAGNYYAVKKDSVSKATATGKTFTDAKGNVYPILMSSRGKLFYNRTAKSSGNVYKVYIKED